MHLNLFIRHCFPQWANVFTMANKVMIDLSRQDEEFHRHLQTIAKIRPRINPKVSIPLLIFISKLSVLIGFRHGNHFLGKRQCEKIHS